MNNYEKYRPNPADYTYRQDYYKAMARWRYKYNLGSRGHEPFQARIRAYRKAKWAIEWVLDGCPSHEHLIYKDTGKQYIPQKHFVTKPNTP